MKSRMNSNDGLIQLIEKEEDLPGDTSASEDRSPPSDSRHPRLHQTWAGEDRHAEQNSRSSPSKPETLKNLPSDKPATFRALPNCDADAQQKRGSRPYKHAEIIENGRKHSNSFLFPQESIAHTFKKSSMKQTGTFHYDNSSKSSSQEKTHAALKGDRRPENIIGGDFYEESPQKRQPERHTSLRLAVSEDTRLNLNLTSDNRLENDYREWGLQRSTAEFAGSNELRTQKQAPGHSSTKREPDSASNFPPTSQASPNPPRWSQRPLSTQKHPQTHLATHKPFHTTSSRLEVATPLSEAKGARLLPANHPSIKNFSSTFNFTDKRLTKSRASGSYINILSDTHLSPQRQESLAFPVPQQVVSRESSARHIQLQQTNHSSKKNNDFRPVFDPRGKQQDGIGAHYLQNRGLAAETQDARFIVNTPMLGLHCLGSTGQDCNEDTGAAVWASFNRLLQVAMRHCPEDSSVIVDKQNLVDINQIIACLDGRLESAKKELKESHLKSSKLDEQNKVLQAQLQDCEAMIKCHLEHLERSSGNRLPQRKSERTVYSPNHEYGLGLQRPGSDAMYATAISNRREELRREDVSSQGHAIASSLYKKYDFRKHNGHMQPSSEKPQGAISTRDLGQPAKSDQIDRKLREKGLPVRQPAGGYSKQSVLGSFEVSRQDVVRSNNELEDTNYETHFYYDSVQGPMQIQEQKVKCGTHCNCSETHTENLTLKGPDAGQSNTSYEEEQNGDIVKELLRQNRSMQNIYHTPLTAVSRHLPNKKSSLSFLKVDLSEGRLPDPQPTVLKASERRSIREPKKGTPTSAGKPKTGLTLLTQEIKSIISKREYQQKKTTHFKN